MRGHVDVVNHTAVAGWACGPRGEEVSVEIELNGTIWASIPCREPRPDLRKLGITTGGGGFNYRIDPPHDIENDLCVRVRIAGQPAYLPGVTGIAAISADLLRAQGFSIRSPLFAVAAMDAETSGADCLLRALVASISKTAPKVRCSDPARMKRLQVVAAAARPLYVSFGVRFHAVEALLNIADCPHLHLQFSDGSDDHPEPQGLICVPGTDFDGSGIAPLDSIERVSGRITQRQFALRGLTSAALLKRLLDSVAPGLPAGRWLDWGCGAGRVTVPLKRHVAKEWDVCGADIEQLNIETISRLAPDIAFHHVALHPPLPFSASTFDVVHGISVLTHLTKETQLAWLDELRRVTRSGGIIILTTHGELTILEMPHLINTPIFRKFCTDGLSDEIQDEFFSQYLPDKNYYRATFQSYSYSSRIFAERFDVLRHIPGGNEIRQDYWVLRNRK